MNFLPKPCSAKRGANFSPVTYQPPKISLPPFGNAFLKTRQHSTLYFSSVKLPLWKKISPPPIKFASSSVNKVPIPTRANFFTLPEKHYSIARTPYFAPATPMKAGRRTLKQLRITKACGAIYWHRQCSTSRAPTKPWKRQKNPILRLKTSKRNSRKAHF